MAGPENSTLRAGSSSLPPSMYAVHWASSSGFPTQVNILTVLPFIPEVPELAPPEVPELAPPAQPANAAAARPTDNVAATTARTRLDILCCRLARSVRPYTLGFGVIIATPWLIVIDLVVGA